MSGTIITGTIKAKPPLKAFAFIEAAVKGEPDIFFHASETGEQFDKMNAGDKVTYEMGEGNDGRTAAKNVRLAA